MTRPITQENDRNFDDLAHRFKRNVYDRLKGDIRLAVLTRDFNQYLDDLFARNMTHDDFKPLRILDAGGGQGQFSLQLAKLGHSVVLCDISAEMLKLAKAGAEAEGVLHAIEYHHCSILELAQNTKETFDLVLCHAVLEWVVEPQPLLNKLQSFLKPDGFLSLTFYNVNSIMMKNLLRTNFKKVLEDDYRGYRGSLTPTYPKSIEEVNAWLGDLALDELCRSGIRCFHDYILEPSHRVHEPENQLALELRLSRQEPWRSLGRYIHVLSKKSLA